jgi:hypothetical protein
MPLLRPRSQRRRGRLREFTTRSCPFNGHQVSGCLRLCQPIGDSGVCGRVAPHAMIGRTQAAIARCEARRKPSCRTPAEETREL